MDTSTLIINILFVISILWYLLPRYLTYQFKKQVEQTGSLAKSDINRVSRLIILSGFISGITLYAILPLAWVAEREFPYPFYLLSSIICIPPFPLILWIGFKWHVWRLRKKYGQPENEKDNDHLIVD